MEQEFIKLLVRLEHGELVNIVSNFIETEQIRQMLIDNISDGDKESIIENHKN